MNFFLLIFRGVGAIAEFFIDFFYTIYTIVVELWEEDKAMLFLLIAVLSSLIESIVDLLTHFGVGPFCGL
jgi:uncharacterized RDD family membrane protein YckC